MRALRPGNAGSSAAEDPSRLLRNIRRTRAYREAFGDGVAEVPRRSRAEQLAEARAVKAARVLRKPAAAPRVHAPTSAVVEAQPALAALNVAKVAMPRAPQRLVAGALSGSQNDSGVLPLQPLVRAVCQAARGAKVEPAEIVRLGSRFWGCSGAPVSRMSTIRGLAEAVDIPEKRIGEMTCTLASAMVHVDRERRYSLEALLSCLARPSDLLCYIECVASDETPLKMAVRHSASLESSAVAASSRSAPSRVIQETGLPSISTGAGRITTTCKILQSEAQFGILVRAPSGELVSFVGRAQGWLQLLPRGPAQP